MESLNVGASSKDLGRVLKGRDVDASAAVDLFDATPADGDSFDAAPGDVLEATTTPQAPNHTKSHL